MRRLPELATFEPAPGLSWSQAYGWLVRTKSKVPAEPAVRVARFVPTFYKPALVTPASTSLLDYLFPELRLLKNTRRATT